MTTATTIGITGASGALGRAVAERVLASPDAHHVVLTTRRPETLADRGAQVRRADFADPASLGSAFAGVDRLLLISTADHAARLEHHRAAVDAARRAGVAHIVYTSVPEPIPENPALVVASHAGTEEALAASGAAWTSLRNNLYAHLQIPTIRHAAVEGRLVTNDPTGAIAYVTREDCAAAAAAVLLGGGYQDRALDITGPAAVTAEDLADLAADLRGGPVPVVTLDDAAFVAHLRGAGLPIDVAELVASFGAAARLGHLDTVTTHVADLTGRRPTALVELLAPASAP